MTSVNGFAWSCRRYYYKSSNLFVLFFALSSNVHHLTWVSQALWIFGIKSKPSRHFDKGAMQRNGDDQNHCKCYNNPVTEMPHSQNYFTDCCVEIPVIAQSFIYLLNVKSNTTNEKWIGFPKKRLYKMMMHAVYCICLCSCVICWFCVSLCMLLWIVITLAHWKFKFKVSL